jgi:predicted anti-sigma-YlaC factor YlaD
MMSARLDGRLSSTETACLDEHLTTCDRCLAEWRALASLDRLMGTAQLMPAPPRLRIDVMARVVRRDQARRALVGGTTLALGTLALILLLLAPMIPAVLNATDVFPVLAGGGPETITRLLALLSTTGRTMLVLVESFAVPLAFLGLCGLLGALMLNGLCIRAVRRLRAQ